MPYKHRAVPVPMKPERWWGIFNYGNLIDIRRRRRDAWKYVDDLNPNDEGYAKWRRYYTVEPVMITKAKP